VDRFLLDREIGQPMSVWMRRPATAVLLLTGLSGCSGIQSALDPAGEEARGVALLFWITVVGAALIWMAVVATLFYASRNARRTWTEHSAGRIILWGGAVFPIVTLTLLLAFTLWLMPSLRPSAVAGDGALRIEITGKQYWWRVVYHPPDGPPVEAANEVRLPVGQRVDLSLRSDDVIHSFWIPALGGKMDMIPGRTNKLTLKAEKTGVFRGPCAEFCGTSHALMALSAVTLEAAAFKTWLAQQGSPSANVAAAGAELFTRHGCGACHAIAGTMATGRVGPDLSHVGSRQTLGAGILRNTEAAIARFIAEPDKIKPGSQMPSFGMLPAAEIEAMAAYLKGLE
jgi:cytochrome c oxidase subunit 2